MAALRVSDGNMLRRRVHVRESVRRWKANWSGHRPTPMSCGWCPFPQVLADELSALMIGKSPDDLIFAAPEGRVLRVSNCVIGCSIEQSSAPSPKARPSRVVTLHDLRHTAVPLSIGAGAVQTILGHPSAVLTLDTYADLFPDDWSWFPRISTKSLESAADQLRTGTKKGPDLDNQAGPLTATNVSRGGGIRTHDLFVPNEARYQAAPHPV